MSSHHIVRDEQEPALIVHKLDPFPTEVLHALLEWSPTVIACEAAINRFTSLGHKLDVGLISFHNFNKWQGQLADQQPIKIITTQNGGFLMTALTIVQKEGHNAVNVVTDDDSYHEVVELLLDWIHVLDVVLFTSTKRILFVREGTFKKWVPAKTKLDLVCIHGPCKWDVDGVKSAARSMEIDELRIYKQEEGELIIQSNQPPFLVIEEL